MKFKLFTDDDLHFAIVYYPKGININTDSNYILIYNYMRGHSMFTGGPFRLNHNALMRFKYIRTPEKPRFTPGRNEILIKRNFLKHAFINMVTPEYLRLIKENIKL